MRRVIAFATFIIILLISLSILGIYLKKQFTADSVEYINVTIDLYTIKETTGEREKRPYDTIFIGAGDDLDQIEQIFLNLQETEFSDITIDGTSNCDVSINYKKSTKNNLYTMSYNIWYDKKHIDNVILKSGSYYYIMDSSQSSDFYDIIDRR